MRIGLVSLGRRGAGIPISLELASWLSRKAEMLAVLSEAAGALPAWQDLHIERIAAATYHSLPGALWAWVDQGRLNRLANRIRLWQPDVLFYPLFFTMNPFLQRRLRGIPSIVAVHDPRPHPGLEGFVYKVLEDISIRQATRCVLFSQALVRELNQRGVPPEKVDIAPLGEFSYYRQLADNSGHHTSSQPPVLLFFGRIEPYKGVDVLIKAFRELYVKFPATRLRIVGSGTVQQLRELAQGLPGVEIDNRWVEDHEVADIFRQADIVVLPYTSGSQSGIIPIAASFGLPVIATRVGGIPEQLEHARTGWLVEPGSAIQLAEALERLLSNRGLAATLGANLQEEYHHRFSWEKAAGIILNSCQKAIQDKKSSL